MDNKHDVAEGTYDCVLSGYVKRQEKHYGRDCSSHFVLSLGVVPVDDPESETYYAELPLVFKVGVDYDFYDKATNKSVTRHATSADTTDAIEYAKKLFPAWVEFMETLPDTATMKDAFAWFTNGTCTGTQCRAKLKNREYLDKDGTTMKIAHDATLYAPGGNITMDDFDKDFGAALKASGFKLCKKVTKAAKAAVAASAAAPAAPATQVKRDAPKPPAAAPAAPAAPALPSCSNHVFTYEEAWAAYEENFKATDPNGNNYWAEVSRIVGKPASDYKTFTSAEWRKCVDVFSVPF